MEVFGCIVYITVPQNIGLQIEHSTLAFGLTLGENTTNNKCRTRRVWALGVIIQY